MDKNNIRIIEADSEAIWYRPLLESKEALETMEMNPFIIEFYLEDEDRNGNRVTYPCEVVAGKCTTEDEGRRDVLVALVCEDVGACEGGFFDMETGADLSVEEVKEILAERGKIVSFYMPWKHIPMTWEKNDDGTYRLKKD